MFLHVGVPKSGTSFLQATLRANADRLAEQGVWYPTQQHRGLFHAALELTGNHPGWGVPQQRVEGSWAGLCREARRRGGTSVFSNELFSNVRAEDVPAALAELDGCEVHVVATARDLARQLPAEWQEGVKHGRGLGFDAFLARVLDPDREHSHATKFWRHQDLTDVLGRWGRDLPPARVHVVTCPPPGAPRDLLWRRFCSVVGVDPSSATLPESGANTSLGVTAVDVLARVNRRLHSGATPPHLRRTVKQVLVNEALRSDGSERVTTPAELVPRLAEITAEWVRRIGAAGYDVVGDLDDLTPRLVAGGVSADHRVTARASRDLAVDAVAVLTKEVAALRAELRELQASSSPARGPGEPRARALARRLRHRLGTGWAAAERTGRPEPARVSSGQGEEELLHPLGVDAVEAVVAGKALPQAGGHDREARPVEGTGDGRELGDDVLAVATLLDHAEHAGELTLRALDAVDRGAEVLRVELHVYS